MFKVKFLVLVALMLVGFQLASANIMSQPITSNRVAEIPILVTEALVKPPFLPVNHQRVDVFVVFVYSSGARSVQYLTTVYTDAQGKAYINYHDYRFFHTPAVVDIFLLITVRGKTKEWHPAIQQPMVFQFLMSPGSDF